MNNKKFLQNIKVGDWVEYEFDDNRISPCYIREINTHSFTDVSGKQIIKVKLGSSSEWRNITKIHRKLSEAEVLKYGF